MLEATRTPEEVLDAAQSTDQTKTLPKEKPEEKTVEAKEAAAENYFAELKARLKSASERITEPLPDALLDQKATQAAAAFHQQWQENSGYTERMKPFYQDNYGPSDFSAADEELEARLTRSYAANKPTLRRNEQGVLQIDIQNTDYANLPSRWQEENKAAAVGILEQVQAALKAGQKLDEDFLEAAAENVHIQWIERNTWAQEAGVEEGKPYSEISQMLKNKDREKVVRVIELYAELSQKEE